MTEIPNKTPRWIKLTLFFSLAVNLLIVGIVAGHLLRGGGDPDRRGSAFFSGAGPFLAAMDRGDRRAFLRSLRDEVGHRGLDPRGRKAAIREMAAVIGAEPFDAAALSAELERQLSTVAELTAAAQAAFVAWVSELSPEDRAQFAERLAEQVNWRQPR